MVAEGKDDLMEEFFATGTLPMEHIVSGLREEMRERRLFPILCGSASQNIGRDLLLDFIDEILPSPLEGTKLAASNGRRQESAPGSNRRGTRCLFSCSKRMADPFAGRLSYFKVMSGSLKNDASLLNMRNDAAETSGSHLVRRSGNN